MSKPLISKSKQKDIAQERIKTLFQEAQKIFSQNPALAHRYVTLARNIAIELKRRFCKHCYKYLQPGVNARVRVSNGKVIISCFECKKFMRIPIR